MKMVQQYRENNSHFQAQYKVWLNESKGKKQKEKVNNPVVKAYLDLTSLGV